MMHDRFVSPARATPAVEFEPRWPIGWSILGAFGVSALLWWGVISAGAAIASYLSR